MQVPGTNDTQNARPLVLVALVIVSILLMTGWMRESDTGPLHRVRDGVHAIVAPVGMAGEYVTTPFRVMGRFFADLGVSRSGIQELQQQNAELRRRNAELEEAAQENVRLSALLKFSQDKEIKTLGARVIGRPANAWEGVVTVDRGSSDGIKPGMPVVSSAGLLGQVIEVAANSSRVRLINDQASGVAAMVQRSRAEGIARGSIDGRLSLDFVSTETTVTTGDVVITSGMGGAYPKGLLIGEVADVASQPGALYQTITLRQAATPRSLEEVLIITSQPAVSQEVGK